MQVLIIKVSVNRRTEGHEAALLCLVDLMNTFFEVTNGSEGEIKIHRKKKIYDKQEECNREEENETNKEGKTMRWLKR